MKLICDETDRRKPSYQKKRAAHFLAAFLIRQLCLDNFVHTIIYVHMDFTWDPIKDGINKSKHGISFETASLVFSDPLHMSVLHRVVNGEQRWKTMGLVGGLVIIVVVHTYTEKEDKEIIRIISARKATKRERKYYEKGNH